LSIKNIPNPRQSLTLISLIIGKVETTKMKTFLSHKKKKLFFRLFHKPGGTNAEREGKMMRNLSLNLVMMDSDTSPARKLYKSLLAPLVMTRGCCCFFHPFRRVYKNHNG
jgi:hypothetical protein